MDYTSTHECHKEKLDQVLSPNKSEEVVPDLLFLKAVEKTNIDVTKNMVRRRFK